MYTYICIFSCIYSRSVLLHFFFLFFFFNDTATTEIYTLSLHDALPIFVYNNNRSPVEYFHRSFVFHLQNCDCRSEEHTSELQSLRHLVCRLLLEKKKTKSTSTIALTSTSTSIAFTTPTVIARATKSITS